MEPCGGSVPANLRERKGACCSLPPSGTSVLRLAQSGCVAVCTQVTAEPAHVCVPSPSREDWLGELTGAGCSGLREACVPALWKHCGCVGGPRVWPGLWAVTVGGSPRSGLPDSLMRVTAVGSCVWLLWQRGRILHPLGLVPRHWSPLRRGG